MSNYGRVVKQPAAVARTYPQRKEQAKKVLALLAGGMPLDTVCKQEGMPSKVTVFDWIHRFPLFANDYRAAREIQAHVFADQIVAIADTPILGVREISREIKTPQGITTVTETTTVDMIEHRKLQVHARQWTVSKILPKIYGERTEIHNTGAVGHVVMTPDELETRALKVIEEF